MQTLNANSNERTLLSATYDLIFRNDYLDVVLLDDISTGRKYWKGTALEWANILRSHKQHDAHGIIASALAYGDTAVKAGIQLGKVAEVSDGSSDRRIEPTVDAYGLSGNPKTWMPAAGRPRPILMTGVTGCDGF